MNRISVYPSSYHLVNTKYRTARGFGLSPYGFLQTIRFVINALTNGLFSYKNPDIKSMNLLPKNGSTNNFSKPLKKNNITRIAFLGDTMTSTSGNSPELGERLIQKLGSVDIIVANIESPVIYSEEKQVRNGLTFKMNSTYLKFIEECNTKALLVFNIANNHAADGSKSDELSLKEKTLSRIGSILPHTSSFAVVRKILEKLKGIFPVLSKPVIDKSVIQRTVRSLKKTFPRCEVIGAEVEGAHPILSIDINGFKMGIVGFTDVMNRDKHHLKKPVIRGSDITTQSMREARGKHDVLIAFPHANEEQSYHPIKETRDRWYALQKEGIFDCIVGHGSHTVHPAELTSNNKLLFHSIGNFFSPKGKSQTKVGLLPIINFHAEEESNALTCDYDVNIIQQVKEKVDLADEGVDATYPKIMKRILGFFDSPCKKDLT